MLVLTLNTFALLSLSFSHLFSQDIADGPQLISVDSTPVVLVITSHESGVIPATMIGIKSGKVLFGEPSQFFTGTNTRAVSNLRTLSPLAGQSCLISIGADGDIRWVPDGPPQTPGEISRADIDALASFVEAAECKLDYTAAILNNTPSNAADELSYVSAVVGDDLLAVGFGNEPDGDPVAYAQLWNTFAKAALARDSNLRFKGPDTGIASELGVWLTAWYEENSSLPLAYGTQHFYVSGPAGCSTCTESRMLEKRSSEAYWNKMVTQKDDFETDITKGLPVLLTETNNFYGGGAPGVSNSYGSALYAFDFVFQAAEARFTGTAFTISDNWSQGYSPLNLVNGYSYGPEPEYYGMYMAALMGYGPMLSTTVQSAGGLHAYTVDDKATGTLNTAFINTTATEYKVHTRYPAGTELKGCSSYIMSDSLGISDTVASRLNIQGGHFDSDSHIVLGPPNPVFADQAIADLEIPAYSGVVVACTH